MSRLRVHPTKEVINEIIGLQGNFTDAVSPDTAIVIVSGLSSLLRVSIAVAYIPIAPKSRPADGRFTGCKFSLYGDIVTGDGEVVRLSITPINNGGSMAAPDAWEGQSTLEQIEVYATLVDLLDPGTGRWEVVVTVEPGDSGICGAQFDALARAVSVSSPNKLLHLGST